MPARYVVTRPPIQIIGNVATTSATARRCGQGETVRTSGDWAAGIRAKTRRTKMAKTLPGAQWAGAGTGPWPGAATGAAPGVIRRRLGLRIVIGVDFRRAVFVRPAINDRLEIEVAVARRAGGRPFQRVGVPGIAPDARAEEDAVDEVDGKDDLVATMPMAQIGDELVQRLQVRRRSDSGRCRPGGAASRRPPECAWGRTCR